MIRRNSPPRVSIELTLCSVLLSLAAWEVVLACWWNLVSFKHDGDPRLLAKSVCFCYSFACIVDRRGGRERRWVLILVHFCLQFT